MRVFCSTNYCGLLDAQRCHDRQTIATLMAARDAAQAEANMLRAQLDAARETLGGALEGKEFYYQEYCRLAKEAR
jgi:predicted RecB family nuclease